MSVIPKLQKADNWKKEPWLLLVIGGPLSVVCASLFSGYIAFSGADKVVSADYYKQGLMVNKDIERDAEAEKMQLVANLTLQSNGQIQMKLIGIGTLPNTVLLSVATSDEDELVESTHRLPMIQVAPGEYQGRLGVVNAHVMHIKLEGGNWRLTSDWMHPLQSGLEINAVQHK